MYTNPATGQLASIYAAHLVARNAQGRPVAGRETRRGMREGCFLARESAPAWEALATAWSNAPGTVKAWSDLHLGHANIIAYQDRPFTDMDQQDAAFLAAAKATVAPTDWLLFVGDVAMWRDAARIAAWLDQCPGRKAVVLGNHDVRGRACPKTLADWQAIGFEAVASSMELPIPQGTLWITHFPLPEAQMPDGIANLHGHVHSRSWAGRHINACVEVNGYSPRPLADMLAALPPSLARPPAP